MQTASSRVVQFNPADGFASFSNLNWSTDFWFPSLIASLANLSLLLLAFAPSSGLAWLIVLAFSGWLLRRARK